jgi:hypothetical protein
MAAWFWTEGDGMSFVYAVRSNFTRPDLEAQWHAWYGGPKLAEMMTHPHFLSGQRYEAVGLDTTIRYLALWVVDSPEAFTTPEYKASWGWADWKPYISHWSRNLYDAGDRDMTALLDVPVGGALYLAAFENATADAEPWRLMAQDLRGDVIWMRAVGLDRSCPLLGVQRLADPGKVSPLPPALAASVRETTFRPLTERRRARQPT